MKNYRQDLLSLFTRQGFHGVYPQFDLCPAMVDKFEKKFGHRDYVNEFDFAMRHVYESFLTQSFTDWRAKYFANEKFLDTVHFDIWGVAHESTPESMHMNRMYHPMKNFTTIEEFKNYPYPEFDTSKLENFVKQVKKLHADNYFVSGCMHCTIWEAAWYMRSMEEMMMGMIIDDELTNYHLDRITELACKRAEVFARADVDMLFLGDDIGMQHSIMMSHEMYRKFLKERLRKVINSAKKIKPDLLIAYHSCGFVEPFLDDLIDVGVNILNPVQPECMDFAEIHAKYGDKLSFLGTLGTQQLFPYGSPEDVKNETWKNLKIAGEHGGLLPMPTHLVEPEVPLENILSYVEACRDFKF